LYLVLGFDRFLRLTPTASDCHPDWNMGHVNVTSYRLPYARQAAHSIEAQKSPSHATSVTRVVMLD